MISVCKKNVPADYGYDERRFVLYPLHLRVQDKQYWSLLILKNSKKWDHTANISAYYLSSLGNDEPPKDLLKKVLKHISDSVQRRLDQKQPRSMQIRFAYEQNQLIPLPLANIKLERVNVCITDSFEDTGFHLLNWLQCAVNRNRGFLDELSKQTNSIQYYEGEDVAKRWKEDISKHLEKHLYESTSLQTEKRLTRSTQKYDTTSKSNTTLPKTNRNPNLNSNQKSKFKNKVH